MRNIRFRAWSATRNKMVDSSTVTTVFWPSLRFCEYNNKGKQVDLPVMQSTGFKDNDGVEVYEGDIIESVFLAPDEKFESFGRVYWDDVSLSFRVLDLKFGEDSEIGEFCDPKVIGNIHENPELLN